MPYTLLNAVNAVMKQVKFIGGDSEALTSLTDTARQPAVDEIVRLINEVHRDLYLKAGCPLPKITSNWQITLADGVRDYTLPNLNGENIFEGIIWPLVDQTNGNQIWEYPGGFEAMWRDQLQPSTYTGLPQYAAIRPDRDTSYMGSAYSYFSLRMDRAPTSAEAGRVFSMRFYRRVGLTSASDTFQCSDSVIDCLIPAVGEKWRALRSGDFNAGYYREQIGNAAQFLAQQPARTRY